MTLQAYFTPRLTGSANGSTIRLGAENTVFKRKRPRELAFFYARRKSGVRGNKALRRSNNSAALKRFSTPGARAARGTRPEKPSSRTVPMSLIPTGPDVGSNVVLFPPRQKGQRGLFHMIVEDDAMAPTIRRGSLLFLYGRDQFFHGDDIYALPGLGDEPCSVYRCQSIGSGIRLFKDADCNRVLMFSTAEWKKARPWRVGGVLTPRTPEFEHYMREMVAQ